MKKVEKVLLSFNGLVHTVIVIWETPTPRQIQSDESSPQPRTFLLHLVASDQEVYLLRRPASLMPPVPFNQFQRPFVAAEAAPPSRWWFEDKSSVGLCNDGAVWAQGVWYQESSSLFHLP